MPASTADSSLESSSAASKDALMQLERKLLDLAFGKVKFSVISALLLASLIVIALWSVIEHERLLAWLAGIAGIKALHFLYLHRYKRHGHRADIAPGTWKTGLVAGAAATGLGWGSAVFCFPSSPFNPLTLLGVFVLPSTPFDPVTVLLIFILAGVTAYASVAMAFVPLAAFAFFACAWLPLAIWLFSFGEQMYVVMGLIALSYLGVMVLLSRRMYATVCSLISVTEENRGLRTAQQESDWRMQRFFESAPGFFYTACMSVDGKSTMPFASSGIHELFDLASGDVADSMSPLFSLVRAEDIERVIKAREESRRNLSPFHIEFRINHRIKGERWIELHSLPQREPDGSTNWHGFMQDITGRKGLEESLAAREREFRTLAENFPDVVIRYDIDGRRTYVNRALAKLAGIEPDEMLGKFLEDTPLVDPEAYMAELHRVVATREAALLEVAAREPGGEIFWYQARFVPEFDADNHVSGVLMVAGDITERKFSEQYEQFRSHTLELLAGNHALSDILDEVVRGVEQLNSRMLCSILLLDSQGKHLVDGIAPSLPDFYTAAIDGLEIGMGVGSCGTCAASGERVIVENIQTHPYWAPFKELAAKAGLGACWSQPVRASSGKVLGTFAIYHREAHAPTAQDISLIEKVAHIASIAIERKRMEAELAARERDFRSLAENLPDNIARWDVEGRYLYINPTHERLLGVAASEVVGKPLPDTHEHVKAALAQVLASGRSVELVRQTILIDGELQTHEVSLVPEFDAAGHVVSVLGLGRNMTEYYRMRDAIAAREQEFRSLAESSPDAIVRYDREGRHRYLNITLVRILGLSSVEEVIGKRPVEVWPDGRFDPIEQAAARAIETGDAQIIEMHSPGESGELVESLISVVPERDEHGSIVGTLAFGRDITAIRATERKLAHFVDNLPGMAYTFRLAPDGAMGFTYVSQAVKDIYGLTEEEARGDFRAVHAFVPEEDRQRIEAAIVESARNLSPKYVEFRICRPGEPERWLDARSLPERQADGSIVWHGIMLDVTERKHMESLVTQERATLRTFFDAMPGQAWIKDREGRYLACNPIHESYFGVPEAEIVGKTDFDFVDAELAAFFRMKDKEAEAAGKPCVNEEWVTFASDGRRALLETVKSPVFDAEGKVIGVIGVAQDITERKRYEAVQQRLSRLAESAPGFMFTSHLRPDGTISMPYASAAIQQIFGLQPADVEDSLAPLQARIHADDRERVAEIIQKSACQLALCNAEFRVMHPEKGEIWVEARSMPQAQPDGGIQWHGFMVDITERKRMQGTLVERQAFLDSLFEAIPVPVFYKDREGRYQGFNRAYESVFGADREQLIGKSVFDIHPRELAETYHAKDEEVFERRVALQQYEYRIKHVNGTLRDVLFSKAAFTDAHGEVSGLIGAVIDITERKRAELALRASEEQAQSRSNLLNAIVESSPDVIVFALDTQYRYLSFNRKHQETMRAIWGKEIAAGMSMLDVIGDHPDREKAKQGFDRALSGESFVQEEAYGDELLSRQYWQNYWSPIRAETGEVVGLTCFVMNVTERRRIEEAMRANEEKLSTLFALSPLGIALTDMDGRYVEFNEAFRAICGYPSDELMALDYWTLTPREYEAQEAAQLESLMQTGRYGPYEKEYRQKDGTLVPIQLNGVLVTGQDGKQYIWSIVEDITERKKTEVLLKERFERIVELNDYLEENARTLEEHAVELEASQEQLKEALEFSSGVINAIPDILFEMDREGRYHGIWTQKPELLAAQKALLLNKTLHEVLPRETADIALAAIRDADENGFSYGNVIDIALPSGEIRWFELSISRKQGGSPSDTRFIVLSRDVTERKQTEDVLRFVAEGEWMRDGESFLDALVRYLGKSLGVDYVVIDKVADEPGYVETVARYAKGELMPNVRYALQSTPCGEVMAGVHCCHGENIQGLFPEAGLLKDLQVESYAGIPLRDIGGAAIGLIAVLDGKPLADAHFVKSILQMVASSVSAELERSRMEQVLRENYDALNEAQRISHIGNWELDLASGALLWSDEIYRIFEIDQERFGASYDAFLNAIHPDDRDAVSRAYETSLETRSPYEIEHRLLFADGRIKYVHERCETRYDEGGKPLRSLGTVQDITARKQAEDSLRESYDKISELNRHLEKNALRLEQNARYLEEQATELEASQEQLKQTEAWYRSILHSAPEGMLVVDDRGLIMQVNARLEAMFGYESGELPGHRVEVLLPQAVRETHVGQRAGYFASGVASRPAMAGKTLFGCRKDGSTFPVDVSLSRLPDLDGRRSAVCASVRDITERQAMEAARETALAEAQRLAQLRSAFMAQMSHELRTPLNGILGYAQNLLQGDALGEKQVAGLNIIQHSGEHLLSLINGLLDHAAIEANKFELIEGDIELDSFLSAIVGIIRVKVEQKNLAFTCEAEGELPAVVRGDAQRLRQVLINLLANAVKFTDSGSVILRVRMAASSRIRFEVQDSGVGIAADQLENIFLPFEQAGELQRRAGGSGLGLAISRTLVRLMGGDIRVESRPGAGSTFSFEIEIGVVQSGRAGIDAAALSERAETRVAQAMPMLPAPSRQELDTLHALALRGSMRDVTRHADRLAEADARYQPFAAQLRRLAQSFQTKALLGLIEQYRNWKIDE